MVTGIAVAWLRLYVCELTGLFSVSVQWRRLYSTTMDTGR